MHQVELQTEHGTKQEHLAGIYTHHRKDTSKTKASNLRAVVLYCLICECDLMSVNTLYAHKVVLVLVLVPEPLDLLPYLVPRPRLPLLPCKMQHQNTYLPCLLFEKLDCFLLEFSPFLLKSSSQIY